MTWTRGVDGDLFHPRNDTTLDLERPIFLSAGRVCLEKNLPAFLDADLPGSKAVIGAGPLLRRYRKRYPKVLFTGYLGPQDYAAALASADVFVFPSLTDTFGLVMLEAMACGVPVAAFPVTGPVDVVRDGSTGVLHEDLSHAARQSLTLDRAACRDHALGFTWRACAEQLFSSLCVNGHGARSA